MKEIQRNIQLQMNYAFEKKKEMQAKTEQEKLDEINVRKPKQKLFFIL